MTFRITISLSTGSLLCGDIVFFDRCRETKTFNVLSTHRLMHSIVSFKILPKTVERSSIEYDSVCSVTRQDSNSISYCNLRQLQFLTKEKKKNNSNG